MEHKIDIVISYVNPNDKVWVDKYNTYLGEGNEAFKHRRFRDTSTLKYVLRSIDMYMKFVNKVFLVVQSDDQVPSWVNRNTVNIVLHEEFIPNEFLPTFNCNTIELFMHKIPNLSDRFIYFNDDMIINRVCAIDDFFYEGKCNLLSKKMNKEVGGNTWFNCLLNNTIVINKHFGINEPYSTWNKFPHTVTPLYKPLCDEAFEIFKDEIYKRTTRFRDYINFNQHFYAYYIENSDMCSKIPITVNYINLNKYEKIFLENAQMQTLCINDSVKASDDEVIEKHKQCVIDLELKFFNTSIYEYDK